MFSHFEAGNDSYLEIPQANPPPGINDAGAHASQISDADSFTYWLSERVRDEGGSPRYPRPFEKSPRCRLRYWA